MLQRAKLSGYWSAKIAIDAKGRSVHADEPGTPSLPLQCGQIAVPNGPGLGVTLDWERIDALRTDGRRGKTV